MAEQVRAASARKTPSKVVSPLPPPARTPPGTAAATRPDKSSPAMTDQAASLVQRCTIVRWAAADTAEALRSELAGGRARAAETRPAAAERCKTPLYPRHDSAAQPMLHPATNS